MRRTHSRWSFLGIAIVASACSSGRYDLELRFDDTVTPSDVRHIEVLASEGQCPSPNELLAGVAPTGTIVAGVGLSQSQSNDLGRLGDLPRGTYALYARGFDASCQAIAAGCSVYSVKAGDARTLVVTLTATTPEPACSGVCNDGDCVEPDGGEPDGGSQVDACLDHPCALGEFCTDLPGNAPNDETGRTCATVSSCGTNEYQFAAPTATSDRLCNTCTACSPTQFESTPCANGNLPQNRVCTLLRTCTNGQYESTPPTATSDRGCTSCTACTAGEYQTQACANGNGPDDRLCAPLTQCGTGFFESMPPTATSNRVCAACRGACATDEYETQACANGNAPNDRTCGDCDPSCTSCAGSPTSCTSCPPNQFWNGAACQNLTNCGPGQRETTAPTPTSNRVCGACTACGPGQYASTPCADGNAPQDRVCTPCTTCSGSQYQTIACGDGSAQNRVCAPLTNCVTGERQSVAPTATTDRQCVACTTCSASQHETVMCANGNTAQDRVCVNNSGTCTLTPVHDADVTNFGGGNSTLTAQTMRVSSDGNSHYYGFVRFNVASGTCAEGGTVPAGSTISNVSLYLTLTNSCGGCTSGYEILRVLSAWNDVSDAPTLNEMVAGSAAATFTRPSPGVTIQINAAGLTSAVQAMLNTPAQDFGFRIGKSGSTTATGTPDQWGTRENTTPASRPRLVIDYTLN